MSYDGTIEVGKLYVSRVGQPIRVYATDGRGMHPIHGAVKTEDGWRQQRWTRDGYDVSKASKSSDDIVGLWVDPPEPKWRPFRGQELQSLLGRIVRRKDNRTKASLVTMVTGDNLYWANQWGTSGCLFDWFELLHADGTWGPCAVLETQP